MDAAIRGALASPIYGERVAKKTRDATSGVRAAALERGFTFPAVTDAWFRPPRGANTGDRLELNGTERQVANLMWANSVVKEGRRLAAEGSMPEAFKKYQQAVDICEDCVQTIIARADGYYDHRRHKEAAREYRRAAGMNPEDEHVKARLRALENVPEMTPEKTNRPTQRSDTRRTPTSLMPNTSVAPPIQPRPLQSQSSRRYQMEAVAIPNDHGIGVNEEDRTTATATMVPRKGVREFVIGRSGTITAKKRDAGRSEIDDAVAMVAMEETTLMIVATAQMTG
ncbi:hypothetical protein THASP1DRAFT_22138 [Thamnocephalis sphaerospora]|uniref:Uncharacterized protein n=1 Tax=Thamnocephalis sphaerospora TaxID=78915 RepID=A0A4P9XV34_9FUNG|nr:hypothetical protein THASP1DRAFT_22138 [Thamnocephalis sphaerospora]|eukprot:RKP10096.1 hypothetical protein THASP1DRAFT_22138 [Thamnocephalis sphaerospora]